MTRDYSVQLLQRRQRLLVRSAQLRTAMASQAQDLKAPLGVVDRARAAVQWLYHHPHWPLGALAALAVLRPQGALRWVGRAVWGWAAFKRAQAWLAAALLRRL